MTTHDEASNAPSGRQMNRREFVQIAIAAGLASTTTLTDASKAFAADARSGWEWEPMRWVQICAAEDDPGRYDISFWLDFLKRTQTQGVCLSAGGVTAFYPTQVAFHTRSPYLGASDMFGDLTHAVKQMGIRVLARVDPHAMHADALAAHPEWVARDRSGAPRRHPTAPDLYLSCANGGVIFDWMPKILKEIVGSYPVDGIFGNRWSGAAGLCFCDVCRTEFKKATSLDLPPDLLNGRDPTVQAYFKWDAEQRYAQLQLWGDVISGVNPAAFFSPGTWGRLDPRRLRQTIRAAYADRQARNGQDPAWLNGRSAKEARCMMPDRPVNGIFAVGETITPYRFMDSNQSSAEIATYLHDGLAHGFRPWMTKFKAEVFDKRWMPIVEHSFQWHALNEQYFRNTENLAEVALVQSTQTSTYYSLIRNDAAATTAITEVQMLGGGVDAASNGYYQALVEARVPFNMADERLLDPEYIDRYKVLVLPNTAALSTAQCDQIRDYVDRGGSIVATHETSLYDEWGKRRDNFALADLFGCDFAGKVEDRINNSYMTVHGPEPLTVGFDDAPRIMAGTRLVHVTSRPGLAQPALTLVPTYPDLPMERVFPKVRETDIPMVYARPFGRGRVVYFPSDLDRTFWECSNQDHLALLRNAVLWAAGGLQPMSVTGPGTVDISYWRQKKSLAAHVVNLTNPMMMKGYMREIVPMGPYEVSLTLPPGIAVQRVNLLEAGRPAQSKRVGDRLVVQIPRIRVHEVVAIDLA